MTCPRRRRAASMAVRRAVRAAAFRDSVNALSQTCSWRRKNTNSARGFLFPRQLIYLSSNAPPARLAAHLAYTHAQPADRIHTYHTARDNGSCRVPRQKKPLQKAFGKVTRRRPYTCRRPLPTAIPHRQPLHCQPQGHCSTKCQTTLIRVSRQHG
ncbi:hypothetical protein BKA81DRAFT_195496 [Phyllosticta paracitricarpa]